MTNLKNLILTYGIDKINTMTKYPSILTFHCLGQKGRLTDQITTSLEGEQMYASEKIDGTNVRLIFWGSEYIIGSRKELLHYSGDVIYNNALGIVDQFYDLEIDQLYPEKLTVVYGELYGGKITAASKNYGKTSHGFRVFDIVEFSSEDLKVLDRSLPEISSWRESTLNSENSKQLRYGQNFLPHSELIGYSMIYDMVPLLEFNPSSWTHEGIYLAMRDTLPQTLVALTDEAQMHPEGLILRNEDRTKIVKLRFEDYEKTLNNKK